MNYIFQLFFIVSILNAELLDTIFWLIACDVQFPVLLTMQWCAIVHWAASANQFAIDRKSFAVNNVAEIVNRSTVARFWWGGCCVFSHQKRWIIAKSFDTWYLLFSLADISCVSELLSRNFELIQFIKKDRVISIITKCLAQIPL